MKRVYAKIFLLVAVVGLSSCMSNDLYAPNMPQVKYTDLTAARYTVNPGDTTSVVATVVQQCPLVQFQWSSTDGQLQGEKGRMTFTAPATSGEVKIDCTVAHPGRASVTKSITVVVQ